MPITGLTKAQPESSGRKMVSRCLLLTIQQTKVQSNPPVISGGTNLRIPSTCLFKRNE
ncbi:unnamed protein product, partial [Protopolystoma xenopodis]